MKPDHDCSPNALAEEVQASMDLNIDAWGSGASCRVMDDDYAASVPGQQAARRWGWL